LVRGLAVFDVSGVDARIKGLAIRILESRLPQRFDRGVLERFYVRALRSGSWWKAPGEARGVIWAALKSTVKIFKSPRVVSALKHAIASIELHAMRGVVILAGLTHAISRGLLNPLSPDVVSKLNYISYLGRCVLETITYYWHIYRR